ncbi:uncharacterized protein LOC108682214 [Hyalella azteca]|uniref:Uncharacterized protein LOC108682214 n=1 Tax=Hyalella azteca TaxID=294128 RepID=A0A979FTY6_HYAAZ|nr:uncharacterized protein LOC108682214 [Hyalella azteca]
MADDCRAKCRRGVLYRWMENLYENLNDVDFFVEGLLEKHLADSLLGYTSLCAVGHPFSKPQCASILPYGKLRPLKVPGSSGII